MPGRVVVTGAASGIGAAVARSLHRRGTTVIALDRDVGSLMAWQREHAAGGIIEVFQIDVTDGRGLRAIFEKLGLQGGLDGVVHCAGVARTGTIVEMDDTTFDFVVDVNLKGTFLVAKHAMPLLVKQGGSFTAIASDAGTQGASGYAAYCASKHGVIGLIKAMALDHGPQGVRSNAICPGFVETTMLERLFAGNPTDRAYYERTVPLGRFAQPDDVAELAAFLSSPSGAYVNGAVIALDGGSTAGYFTSPNV